jgi:hypothetical protein
MVHIYPYTYVPYVVGTLRYRDRYVREHYVQKKIRRDLYERLVGWCGADSPNLCLERLLDVVSGTYVVPAYVPDIGTALAGYLKPYLYSRKPIVLLLAELLGGAREYVPERELLGQGLVARQVAEFSAGTLVYEPGRGVTLSPLLRAVLEICGCGEELARELES